MVISRGLSLWSVSDNGNHFVIYKYVPFVLSNIGEDGKGEGVCLGDWKLARKINVMGVRFGPMVEICRNHHTLLVILIHFVTLDFVLGFAFCPDIRLLLASLDILLHIFRNLLLFRIRSCLVAPFETSCRWSARPS